MQVMQLNVQDDDVVGKLSTASTPRNFSFSTKYELVFRRFFKQLSALYDITRSMRTLNMLAEASYPTNPSHLFEGYMVVSRTPLTFSNDKFRVIFCTNGTIKVCSDFIGNEVFDASDPEIFGKLKYYLQQSA